MTLACLHSPPAEGFTLLNSCSNATTLVLLPIYVSSLFHEPTHRYSTHNSNLVNLPPVKSSYGQHSLSFFGVSLWHSLPLSIRNSDSLVTLTQAASAIYYLTCMCMCEHLYGHQSTTARNMLLLFPQILHRPTWLHFHCLYCYFSFCTILRVPSVVAID